MTIADERVLDNPVWNALNTGNHHLSLGDGLVKCFQKGVAPFVGLKSLNKPCFDALEKFHTPENILALATSEYCEAQSEWKIINRAEIVQMIFRATHLIKKPKHNVIALNQSHVPAMLALTELTKPGPFLDQTIRFGSYHGIVDGDRLIAMAGRRFHVNHFIEISAVCTHPDFVGKGFGSSLLLDQMQRIIKEECIPFLHVRKDNTDAIRLYEHLGFEVRQNIELLIFEK